jgi:hypothetical protein
MGQAEPKGTNSNCLTPTTQTKGKVLDFSVPWLGRSPISNSEFFLKLPKHPLRGALDDTNFAGKAKNVQHSRFCQRNKLTLLSNRLSHIYPDFTIWGTVAKKVAVSSRSQGSQTAERTFFVGQAVPLPMIQPPDWLE